MLCAMFRWGTVREGLMWGWLRRGGVVALSLIFELVSSGPSKTQDPELVFKQFFGVIKEIQRQNELRERNRSQSSPHSSVSPRPYLTRWLVLT
jgi:hypothetical protein